MLLEMSGRATAVAGLRGFVPFNSSCLKSCSRMGSIFFGIVTSLPTARACRHTDTIINNIIAGHKCFNTTYECMQVHCCFLERPQACNKKCEGAQRSQKYGLLTPASASFGYLFKTEYTATASMM